MSRLLVLLIACTGALAGLLPVTASAQQWSEYAFISGTLGVSDSRICIGEASRGELGCPSYAPTISPTGRVNMSNGLTVDSVSLTTGAIIWGYLGSNASYIPNLNTNNISLSTINGVSVSALGGGASPTNVPAFRAHRNNVDQTITASTATKVLFTTEDFDTYNNFSTGTSRFTPTVAGYYIINGSTYCTSSTSCRVYIYQNGLPTTQSAVENGSTIIINTSAILYFNGSSDYVELYAYSGGTTLSGLPRQTYFTGSLLASGNGLISGTGVTALSALTDVALASPATGQVLTYNGTSWVNTTPSATTVISGTTTMVPGWPDAIACPANGGVRIFHLAGDWGSTDDDVFYLEVNSAPNNVYLRFNGDGSWDSAPNATAYTDCLNKSVSQLYASGQAFNFIGNSGAGGGALGDRLTSGTLAVTANSSSNIISLTTNGTTWGYLGSNSSYLPTINTSSISATAVQISSNTAVTCGAGNAGTLRYNNSNTALELCTGTGWQMMGVGIPAGTISAFASTTCPTGWSEYTPARGRFLRGIDNGAGNDPAGTRTPGNTQTDAFQGHHHLNKYSTAYSGYGTSGNGWQSNFAGSLSDGTSSQAFITTPATDGTNGVPRTSSETRPKNVAVTFCQFNGTSNGWNNPLSGGSTVPGGSTGQIQYNTSGSFDGSAGLTYDNANSRLTTVNISATALTVNGVPITGSASGDRITSGTTSAIATPSGTIEVSGSLSVSGSITVSNSVNFKSNAAAVCSTAELGSLITKNGKFFHCRM